MAGPKVTVKRKKNPESRKLAKMDKQFKKASIIKVGVPKGSGNYPDGTPITLVAAVNEFGSPSRGIPERSFLRASLHKNSRKYRQTFRKGLTAIAQGKMKSDNLLKLIGQMAESDVKSYITNLRSPANKPSTVASKKSSNPLIDTGLLRQSIRYVIDAS